MRNSMPSKFLAFGLLLVILISGCAPFAAEPLPTNTPEADVPFATPVPHTIAEVEQLAGFDVKEPTYLPVGVAFDFATYQEAPHPIAILHFKMVHPTYGDMGAFFQIAQESQAEASANSAACAGTGNTCELLQVGDMNVNYYFTPPTESLSWTASEFSFVLTRIAGEPNKIYKDELLKVAGSMK